MSASTDSLRLVPGAPARPRTEAEGTGTETERLRPDTERPRRDPVRIAARLSPLLGLALSIGLVVWGLQTGVLQSLENAATSQEVGGGLDESCQHPVRL